jgi:hypothetical protein
MINILFQLPFHLSPTSSNDLLRLLLAAIIFIRLLITSLINLGTLNVLPFILTINILPSLRTIRLIRITFINLLNRLVIVILMMLSHTRLLLLIRIPFTPMGLVLLRLPGQAITTIHRLIQRHAGGVLIANGTVILGNDVLTILTVLTTDRPHLHRLPLLPQPQFRHQRHIHRLLLVLLLIAIILMRKTQSEDNGRRDVTFHINILFDFIVSITSFSLTSSGRFISRNTYFSASRSMHLIF